VSQRDLTKVLQLMVFIANRHMHRLELHLGRYNKSCIGLDLLKLSAKCLRACCTMNMDKFLLGDWKRRTPAPCLVLRAVNGGDFIMGQNYLILILHPRFKLFLEPRALRDESAIDPRLPRLPVCAIPSFYGIRLTVF
jgi:hypothetical protein